MNDLKVWVLSGIIALLFPTVGFLLSRWVRQQEKLNQTVDNLNKTIGDLRIAIMAIRTWSNERFVTEHEFDKNIVDIKRTLENCKDHCEFTQTRIPNQRG